MDQPDINATNLKLLRPLKNHLRKRLRRRMRNTQRHALHSQRRRHLRRLPSQQNRRSTSALPYHFHIHPPHTARPSRPERLHRRFLRRKPPRIPLILILEFLAISTLPRRIHPPQKRLAMALNRPLHSIHFRNINPHPHNHAAPSSTGTPALAALTHNPTTNTPCSGRLLRRPLFSRFSSPPRPPTRSAVINASATTQLRKHHSHNTPQNARLGL